jgi:hypothetical protein
MSACQVVYTTLSDPPAARCKKRGRLSGQPCKDHEQALALLQSSPRTWKKYLALVSAFEEWEWAQAGDPIRKQEAIAKLRRAAAS